LAAVRLNIAAELPKCKQFFHNNPPYLLFADCKILYHALRDCARAKFHVAGQNRIRFVRFRFAVCFGADLTACGDRLGMPAETNSFDSEHFCQHIRVSRRLYDQRQILNTILTPNLCCRIIRRSCTPQFLFASKAKADCTVSDAAGFCFS
jgi:hypothetical protein